MEIIAEQNHPTDEEILIHEILVSIGDHILENQALIIAEGSKSLFDIESSVPGIIKDILVSKGDSVRIGEKLIILE